MSRQGDFNHERVNETNSEREILIPCEPRPQRRFRPTVEIPLFISFFAGTLSGNVISNFLLFRTCVNILHYNVTTCELLLSKTTKNDDSRNLESEIQKEAALMVMTLSVLGGLMPAILSFFLGAWSDKHGRKALILFPLFGLVVTSSLLVLCSMLPNLNPWWFVFCILPYSMAGGDSTLALGSYCYITDITNDRDRTFRLALLQGAGFLGMLVGSMASNYLFIAIGYRYLFVFTTVVYVIAWLYTLWLPESVVDADNGSICSIFDLNLVKKMCRTCFKSRPNHTGVMLFLLILANSLTIFVQSGISNIEYLFVRQKFQWMLKEYCVFMAVNILVIVFGIFIGMVLLQGLCRISDAVLAIMAYISSILDTIFRALASLSWHMYLAGGVSMLGGLASPLVRSLVTKIVIPEEVGQIFALMSSCEAIVPILAPFLYNTVYASTLNTFPGAIYALSAGLYGTCLLLVIVTQCLMHKNPQTSAKLLVIGQTKYLHEALADFNKFLELDPSNPKAKQAGLHPSNCRPQNSDTPRRPPAFYARASFLSLFCTQKLKTVMVETLKERCNIILKPFGT